MINEPCRPRHTRPRHRDQGDRRHDQTPLPGRQSTSCGADRRLEPPLRVPAGMARGAWARAGVYLGIARFRARTAVGEMGRPGANA